MFPGFDKLNDLPQATFLEQIAHYLRRYPCTATLSTWGSLYAGDVFTTKAFLEKILGYLPQKLFVNTEITIQGNLFANS